MNREDDRHLRMICYLFFKIFNFFKSVILFNFPDMYFRNLCLYNKERIPEFLK